MDKYKKLISNTIIFAIGTFSSKILTFLMVPFYTRVLSESQLGNGDLLVQMANLVIPIASVGIAEAIIRYGLDKAVDKAHVFTGAFTAICCGYLLFIPFYPLLRRFVISQNIGDYAWLVYLFVLTSCLRSLCSRFVRARQLVRLYAFDGVLSTVLVITFNIIFLIVFKMGVVGYVLATILSDLCSALFLFYIAQLHRFLRFHRMEWPVLGSMVRYSIPLIPAAVFWWITNASDHFFVNSMVGSSANGLYVISYKIPTMIILISGFFTDAWQMSAITENGPGRDRFFTKVFNAYQALIFTAASGLILFCKLIIHIIAAPKFYAAWEYTPFLILATSFSCLVTFLGSIYMVEKKSVLTLLTTAAGALCNILLNIGLIPIFGVNGAAFATFFSYFLVFVLRIIDTHRFVKIRVNLFKLMANLVILLGQALLLLYVKEGWILPEALLCLLMILINLREILINLQKILSRRRPSAP